MYKNFQSESELDARQEEIRKQRKLVIEQAKRSYERAEAKKEKARKEGQDTWMLDSVSQRIREEEKQMDKAKKEKKKRKKEKKDKKKKKKKKHSSSSPSSDSDGDRTDKEQWVEAKAKAETVSSSAIRGPQLQRESWMESPLDFIPTTSKQELRDAIKKQKDDAKKEAEKLLEPGRNARELNPHWKDGGTGLPEENPDKHKHNRLAVSSSGAAGDAGLSWLRKAYDRCKQQASDEGRTLEEVAAERWGSLKKLELMIKEAERHQKGGRMESWRDRRNDGRRREDSYRQTNDMLNDGQSKRDGREGREMEINRRREKSRERDNDELQSLTSERNRSRTGFKGNSNDRDEDTNTFRKADRQQKTGFQRPCSGSDSESSPPRSSVRASKDDDTYEKQHSHFHNNRQQYHSGDSRRRHTQPEDKQREENRGPNSNLPRWKKKTEFETSRTDEKAERNMKAEDKHSVGSKNRSRHKRSSSSSSNSSSDSNLESDGSSNVEEQSEPTPITPARVLSEEELNELAAKILRAEIMGDDVIAADLKLQLENARKVREASKSESGTSAPDFLHRRRDGGGKTGGGRKRKEEEEDNVVVLSRTSKAGLVRPVVGALDDSKAAGGKRKKNMATHDSKGERTIYFDNDDKLDLKTMVEQEKAGTAEDQNSMFARLAGRSNDRDLDVDDMFVSKAARKQNEEQATARDRNAAIFEHKKVSGAMENCHRCFGKVSKHLIIAIGTKSYLCLPHHRSLTDGHCFIVPMQHVSAATSMDEDVWQEMQHFRKSIVQMFAAQGEDVVIMETVKNLKHFPHSALECVPLDKELGDLAPIYFKKAIQDAGPEWSDNKKLHSLSSKDVRHVIPKGFPYFSVDFGLQGGYATVIEDESRFQAYFGREIVGGMLDAEPTLWRKPQHESFEDQRKKVLQFAQWWEPYDWTQTLIAGE